MLSRHAVHTSVRVHACRGRSPKPLNPLWPPGAVPAPTPCSPLPCRCSPHCYTERPCHSTTRGERPVLWESVVACRCCHDSLRQGAQSMSAHQHPCCRAKLPGHAGTHHGMGVCSRACRRCEAPRPQTFRGRLPPVRVSVQACSSSRRACSASNQVSLALSVCRDVAVMCAQSPTHYHYHAACSPDSMPACLFACVLWRLTMHSTQAAR